jgi:cell division protein FtsI (penicillin-binding protein 3)
MFNNSPSYYKNRIVKARTENKKYLRIKSNLSYDQYKRLTSFPILSEGRFKGGIIVERKNVREHPLGKVAERTIGYERDFGAVGLEGAYSTHLSGEHGHVLSMKLQNGSWKPLLDLEEREPKDGADIYSTINVHIQDVAHYALLRQLENFEADHGTVVVMEVQTGKIKAIVNLGRTHEGKYFEKLNYAVFESAEPGSTFKLPALVAALEDGVVDTSDVVDVGNGTWRLYDKIIRDSHEGIENGGKKTVKDIFEESSNVGMAKIIYENYSDNPNMFVSRLYAMNLGQKIDINIKGEQEPYIPSPSAPTWSGLSLAQMAYGYEVKITPLQLLSFYNAIANNGVELKPYLVSKIVDDEGGLIEIEPKIINAKICSDKTIKVVRNLLEGAVENGTGKGLNMEKLKIAGKTGTTQLNYWEGYDNMGYSSSFVGYFPAEKPKYSMIVVVNKPDRSKGYYGSKVAAPVFKEIARKIYNEGPEIANDNLILDEELLLAELDQTKESKLNYGYVPDVVGLPVSKAVAMIENSGAKVVLRGKGGKVRSQNYKSGTKIYKNTKVELRLQR